MKWNIGRKCGWAFLFLVMAGAWAAQAQLTIETKCEVPPQADIPAELRCFKLKFKKDLLLKEGANEVDIADCPDGNYTVEINSPEYPTQWENFEIAHGKSNIAKVNFNLCKKRYIIIRYCMNLLAEPKFEGDGLLEGTAAFSDFTYGNPKYYLGWFVRQATAGLGAYGKETFSIDFRHLNRDVGIVVKRGTFQGIRDCSREKFSCNNIDLKKGTLFVCRSSAEDNKYYAKFEVVDIVDEVPSGMDHFDKRR